MFNLKNGVRLFLASSFLLVATALPSYSQTAPKSERLLITVVNIKPELVTEYEAFVKGETIPAMQKAGVKWRDAWVNGVFGPSYQYVYVQPIENFSEFDSAAPMERALGKEAYAAWLAKSRKFQTGLKRYVVNTRPDLSYVTGPIAFGTVAVVSHATAAPGRTAEVETWVKNDLLPAMRQSKVPGYHVSQVSLGGNANEYVTLVLHTNMAELEKGPPVYRIMSKEAGDALYAKLAVGALTNVERYVARLSADLSFRSATTATK